MKKPMTHQVGRKVYSLKDRGSAVRSKLATRLGRGDDAVGNPHRPQIYKFELFELILLLNLDKQFPFEQFEATVSQSTAPSPLLLSSQTSRCEESPARFARTLRLEIRGERDSLRFRRSTRT